MIAPMLAGNPHTPIDVLQKLSNIDFDEDYQDEQIQDSIKLNLSTDFLFSDYVQTEE